jgi:rfaE bifunctional protein kinase chain/domain
MIDTRRLQEILQNFSKTKVAVLGDFFLDLYIQLDRSLSEFSIETHKEAFQAIDFRGQPGAAGVVNNNLSSLNAQHAVIGYIGSDGNGYTLRRALEARGADTSYLIETNERFTPTYTKPMMKELDGSNVELNRIDIINRSPNPESLNTMLGRHLEDALRTHDGVLVVEQVKQDGFGTMSPFLRNLLSELARKNPNKVVMVDSRHFAAAYRNVSLKMNIHEAEVAVDELTGQALDDNLFSKSEHYSQVLWDIQKRPVFLTLGEHGIGNMGQDEYNHLPGYQINGPIDIVGAGDSVLAGIGLSMCAGATSKEAAYIGNLVGSVTVQQLGTTGIVTQDELLRRHHEYQQQIKGN